LLREVCGENIAISHPDIFIYLNYYDGIEPVEVNILTSFATRDPSILKIE
jgi:hypothetical protein